jgi:predicted transcriptional regulator
MADDTTTAPSLDLVTLTASIVVAYASGNHFAASELPKVVTAVHGALINLAQPHQATPAEEQIDRPTASQIKKSITPDAIVSFIDGKPYKTMKRHLSRHGLDPYSYRQRYGLPSDYPMVASNYAARRSELAKGAGLGRTGGRAKQQATE